MGLIRKMASMTTGGLVDFRSDKERTARNTKEMAKEAKKQTALLARKGVGQSDDTVTKIERLAKLKDAGAITPQEFENEKRKLLKG